MATYAHHRAVLAAATFVVIATLSACNPQATHSRQPRPTWHYPQP